MLKYYTDRVRDFVEQQKAFWAIDLIASYQMEAKLKKEEFQNWKIISNEGKFVAICNDGNGKVLVRQNGEFTTLKEGEYDFFLINNVLMFPSEY